MRGDGAKGKEEEEEASNGRRRCAMCAVPRPRAARAVTGREPHQHGGLASARAALKAAEPRARAQGLRSAAPAQEKADGGGVA